MKNLMLMGAVLGASMFAFAVTPALADDHGGDKTKKFEKHDTNGDGVISKSEFLSHAEEKFSKMDTDGNGEISKDERQAVREKMKEKRSEVREKIKERRQNAAE